MTSKANPAYLGLVVNVPLEDGAEYLRVLLHGGGVDGRSHQLLHLRELNKGVQITRGVQGLSFLMGRLFYVFVF